MDEVNNIQKVEENDLIESYKIVVEFLNFLQKSITDVKKEIENNE